MFLHKSAQETIVKFWRTIYRLAKNGTFKVGNEGPFIKIITYVQKCAKCAKMDKYANVFEIFVLNFAFLCPIATCPWWSYAKFEVIFAANHRGGTLKIGLFKLFRTMEMSFFRLWRCQNWQKLVKFYYFSQKSVISAWQLSILGRLDHLSPKYGPLGSFWQTLKKG